MKLLKTKHLNPTHSPTSTNNPDQSTANVCLSGLHYKNCIHSYSFCYNITT